MAEFVALYRGRTVSDAELVALSAQPEVVRRFLNALLGEAEKPEEGSEPVEPEPLRVVPGDKE